MNSCSPGRNRSPFIRAHASAVPSRTSRPIAVPVALAALACGLALPRTCPAQPDPTNSFYVPQSGPVATPSEGTTAIRNFTQCPNNDSGLRGSNARIKIVVKDGLGIPIAGIPAAEICVLLNGGPPVQGFSGVGADSIVANGTWNVSPLCPDPRCIEADAPTDAAGVTYITFAGSTPGSPGVATRDPARKWGHYDSELPVFVSTMPLAGRLTSASPNGSYILRIKNFDIIDGLEATLDAGEYVSFRDLNAVRQELNGSSTLTYWLDFNSDGLVTALDYNLMVSHSNHDCAFPNNP